MTHLSVFQPSVALAAMAFTVIPVLASAQDSRLYAGAAFNFVTQTHSERERLGGTLPGGSVLLGVRVSPRVAVEFESSFSGRHSREYTYPPSPSLTAVVVASRRDTFFSFQLRSRVGVLEPVVGGSYVHSTISRHATIGNRVYFDDSRSADDVAAVVGVDAAVRWVSHLYFVPTFRVVIKAPGASIEQFDDPLGAQTGTGTIVFRYGAGARVTF